MRAGGTESVATGTGVVGTRVAPAPHPPTMNASATVVRHARRAGHSAGRSERVGRMRRSVETGRSALPNESHITDIHRVSACATLRGGKRETRDAAAGVRSELY